MVHQSEDQLFKYATKEDGIGLLKLLKESNANIKEIDFESENLTYNPTELVELDPKIYKTDMILELDHLIVLTEFQSTIVKTPDEKRYRLYTALVDYAKRNNKPIILIVISTAEKTKINEYKINKDCVFTCYDADGTCKCAVEKAYREGKLSFYKPVSCHLYPIRVEKYDTFEAVNYNRWSICKAAEILGKKEKLPVYKFLKEPLVRRFGKDWYEALEEIAGEWEKQKNEE